MPAAEKADFCSPFFVFRAEKSPTEGVLSSYDGLDRIVAQSTKHDQTVGAFADGSVPATDVSFFTFDDAGQLTEVVENSAIVEDYAYDSGGNREDAGVITIGDQNRLTADADFTYTYDNEGNLTRRDAVGSSAYTTYEWDYRNRLTQVKEYDASSTLTAQLDTRYNADDQLVERARQGLVLGFFIETAHDHYVYSGNELALTLNIGGDLQHRTTWGPGVDQLLIDEVFTPNGSVLQDTLWAATDHLGSVNQLVDENGNVVEHREYDSFGALDAAFDEVGATKNPALLDSDFGFAGRRYDATSELYYNRARWYDPTTGRFIGEDPAQDGSNWYAYANNDPVNFRDPSGLSAAGHPLAGGFGSGVTRARNPNIGSGATFNGANFANDAANAIGSNNSFGSFATPTFTTPSGAFDGIGNNSFTSPSSFNTSSFGSSSFDASGFGSGFDKSNFSNILNNGPAAPTFSPFDFGMPPGPLSPAERFANEMRDQRRQDSLDFFQHLVTADLKGIARNSVANNNTIGGELKQIGNAGSAVTPIASDIRDFVEFKTGRDIFTGREFSTTEKVLNGIGLAIPIVGSVILRRLAGGGGEVFDVGLAKDLRKNPVRDTQVNHAPQSRQAESLIGDFNLRNKVGNEPAIRLPTEQHAAVTAAQRTRKVAASARDLLADEIRILRKFTEASNSALKELIRLNKDRHFFDFLELHR